MRFMTIDWSRRKYTPEQFKEAWANSVSIAECARKLGLTVFGATYRSIKLAAKELGLSQEHMTGQGWNVGPKYRQVKRSRPLKEILCADVSYNGNNLRQRLIKEGIKEHRCESCLLDEWLGKPIPLELDHINGDKLDNRLENLQILCPNCHAGTDTYRGKNRGRNYVARKEAIKQQAITKGELIVVQAPLFADKHKCAGCERTVSRNATRCRSCAAIDTDQKISWPSTEELIDRLRTTSYVGLAKELGVSDNAIRKHLKKRGIVPPKGKDRKYS